MRKTVYIYSNVLSFLCSSRFCTLAAPVVIINISEDVLREGVFLIDGTLASYRSIFRLNLLLIVIGIVLFNGRSRE